MLLPKPLQEDEEEDVFVIEDVVLPKLTMWQRVVRAIRTLLGWEAPEEVEEVPLLAMEAELCFEEMR